jgi:hypothetical protein
MPPLSTLRSPPAPITAVPLRRRRVDAVDWAYRLSLLAALGHAVAAPSHLAEWWAYGAFFVTAAIGQAAFAALVLVRRWTWLLLAGIAGNLAIVGLYVLSRTNGVPVGPHREHVEAAGLLDLTCTACELGVIAACVGLLPPRLSARTTTVLMTAGISLWAARLTGLLV